MSPYTSLAYYSLDPPVSSHFASKYSTFSITDRKNGNKYNYMKTVVRKGNNDTASSNNSSSSSSSEWSSKELSSAENQQQQQQANINSSNAIDTTQLSNNNTDIDSSNYDDYGRTKAIYIDNNSLNNPSKRPCIDYNPCRHGQCRLSNSTGDFSCECNVGYMGPFCDLIRHPCDFKPCENGNCEIVGDLYYKCLCKPNYTGINCHIGIDIFK
jgi:hypothetical protein